MSTYAADRAEPLEWETPKDPEESRTYQFDFTDDLDSGDAITGTPTVTATPTDLTVGTPRRAVAR